MTVFLGPLNRVGVSFSPDQIKKIEVLVAQGNIEAAKSIILEVLRKVFCSNNQ